MMHVLISTLVFTKGSMNVVTCKKYRCLMDLMDWTWRPSCISTTTVLIPFSYMYFNSPKKQTSVLTDHVNFPGHIIDYCILWCVRNCSPSLSAPSSSKATSMLSSRGVMCLSVLLPANLNSLSLQSLYLERKFEGTSSSWRILQNSPLSCKQNKVNRKEKNDLPVSDVVHWKWEDNACVQRSLKCHVQNTAITYLIAPDAFFGKIVYKATQIHKNVVHLWCLNDPTWSHLLHGWTCLEVDTSPQFPSQAVAG